MPVIKPPMSHNTATANLRTILASLYPDEAGIRRVVHDAGLAESRIAFSGASANTWHAILAEARNDGKLEDLFRVVLREYGANTELRAAYDAYRQAALQQELHQDSNTNDTPGTNGAGTTHRHGQTHPNHETPLPAWFSVAGVTFGGLTLLFFMGLVVAGLFAVEVPCNTRFPVVVVMGFGAALATSFLGGWAVAEGYLPIPFTQISPIQISVGGGVAVLLIMILLGNWVYLTPECGSNSIWPQVEEMDGDFNVAVAEFGQLDARGAVVASRRGRDLAHDVYAMIDTTVQELQVAGITIRVRSPNLVRRIEGSSEEERARNAEQIARLHAADLLIYANIHFEQDETSLIPYFFISDTKLRDAEELAGIHDFGSAIHVRDDVERNPVASADFRRQTANRARVFANFAIGLGYFALDGYDDAQFYFQRAETLAQQEGLDGNKTLYLFLGTLAALQNNLTVAQGYYGDALALDPRYARAMLGAAQITFLQARHACQPGQIDAATVYQAIEAYRNVLSGRYLPLADIPSKVNLAVGRAYLCLSIGGQDYWEQARAEYTNVIASYDDLPPDEQRRLANLTAEAWADLGLLNYAAANDNTYRDAFSAYDRAINMMTRPDRKAIFQLFVADLHLKLNQCDLAAEYLEDAHQVYEPFRAKNRTISHEGYDQHYRAQKDMIEKNCT